MAIYSSIHWGLLTAGLLTGLALPMQHASAQTLERVAKSGQLTLGYIDDVAPMSSRGADGRLAGYGADLCQAVADTVKAKLPQRALTVRYVPVQAEDAVDKVAGGGVDLLCTPTAETLKRRERVSYSIPVLNGGIAVLIRQDAPKQLRDVVNGQAPVTGPVWRATANGGRVNHTYAVREGTLAEDWARAKSRLLGVTVSTVKVQDDAKGIALVRAKQADAYFGERVLLEQYVARNQLGKELLVAKRVLNTELLGLAMARNDDDFRLLVDRALSQLYLSKTFPAAYARYFGSWEEPTKAAFEGWVRP